jgi:hypothetical protein
MARLKPMEMGVRGDKLTELVKKPDLLKKGIPGVKLSDGRVVPSAYSNGLLMSASPGLQRVALLMDVELIDAKFRLLFKKKRVTLGDWMGLAYVLAREHEPGFKFVAPSGRPPGNPWVWDKGKDAKLVHDIDKLLASGMKVRPACRHLVERSNAYQGAKAEALRSRYRSLKDRA